MKLNEKGFTVIEVIVATAITALLAVGAGMTTVQMLNHSQRGGDWANAVRQAQSVGYWVSEDALMAKTIEIGDDPGTVDDVEFIIVHWKDWENGDTHEIRYLWLDSVDSLKKLKRNEVTKDKDGIEIGNKTTLVADNINTASFSEQTGGWKLSVEACSGDKSVTREYEISQRYST